MRIAIIILLGLFYSMAGDAQEDKHLKGKIIDITHTIYQGKNDTLTIFLDGYKLKINESKRIGDCCVKCKVSFLNDSTVFIKSKFVYFIDGTIYKDRERPVKLKSLNSNAVVLFELLSQKEAKDKLGIKARYGLINIETK